MLEKYLQLLTEIFCELYNFIHSPETLEKARLKENYFTRSRKFSFENIICFLLANFPGSLDSEIRDYFESLGREKSHINESSISQSRNHMNEYPFKRMFEIVRDFYLKFDRSNPAYPYLMIYCGVDGSFLSLPDFKRLAEYFGTCGSRNTSPTARISLIYDSLRHFIFEAVLEPLSFTERDLALNSIRHLSEITDLSRFTFIFDRGYPGLEFFKSLLALKTHFIVRTRNKWYGLNELDTGLGYRIHFEEDLILRAIRLKLTCYQDETLITNIFNVPALDFKQLYYLRWPVEIEFYVLKHVIRLEDFNGYTLNSIRQNFWIALTLSNIASIFRMAAQVIVDKKRNHSGNKYFYQVNISESVSFLHTRIIKLLIEEDKKERERCIKDTIDQIACYVVPVRKDRPKKRSLTRNVFYHFNQKVH